jgi:hypothetical protein
MKYEAWMIKRKIHGPGDYTTGYIDLESELNRCLRMISEKEHKIISVNQSQSDNEIVITIICECP